MLLGLLAVEVHHIAHDAEVEVQLGCGFHGGLSLLNEPVSLAVAVCKYKNHHALHDLLALGLGHGWRLEQLWPEQVVNKDN